MTNSASKTEESPSAGGFPSGLARLSSRLLAFSEREAYLVSIASVYAMLLVRFMPYELVQDSWLALLGGREIVRHGLPTQDTLTVMAQGVEWVDQQWLAKLTLYGLFLAGGVKLALFTHVILLTSAFALALVVARRWGGSSMSVFWVAVASIFLAPWSWQMRAQSFAYVLFVALLWLLGSDSRTPSRRVLLALPILALWANLHGSVVVGALLVALRGVTIAGTSIRATRREPSWKLRSATLVALPGACVFASPYGLSLLDYYRSSLFNPAFADFVDEWQPATLKEAFPFFLLASVVIWFGSRSRKRLTLFEGGALLVVMAGGLLAVRNTVWFALAALMFLPALVDGARGARQAPSPRRRRLTVWLARSTTGALIVAAVVMAVLPVSTYEQDYPERGARAVAAAAARNPTFKVFASERYADWLLWKRPELAGRVALDIRFELYTPEQFRELVAFHERYGSEWKRIAAGYQLIVLDRRADGPLEAPFLGEKGTRVIFRDENLSVLLRARA